MSNIDTSNWSELRIGDIFEKIDTGKINGKAGDFPTSHDAEHEIPLLTSSSQNQGLTRFAPRSACPTILSNVISVASNGAAGETFYQGDEFAVLQDAYAIRPIGQDIPNRECGLFLASVIGARLRGNFDWSNKANWSKVRELKIKLPVIETEEIDWRYMEERIAELEAERIAELEAYLSETGLNDYELTEEDKEILATKLIDSTKQGGQSQSTASGDGCWKEAREFKVQDLFKIQKVQHVLSKEQFEEGASYPVFSAETKNNGIIGYTNHPEFICDNATPTYIIFGDHTRAFNITHQSFSVVSTAKVLKPNIILDDKQMLFILTIWRKGIPNLGYARHWSVAKNCSLLLPVNKQDELDKTYMSRYINAIEKLIIKDVVKYKDDVIDKTKEILERD